MVPPWGPTTTHMVWYHTMSSDRWRCTWSSGSSLLSNRSCSVSEYTEIVVAKHSVVLVSSWFPKSNLKEVLSISKIHAFVWMKLQTCTVIYSIFSKKHTIYTTYITGYHLLQKVKWLCSVAKTEHCNLQSRWSIWWWFNLEELAHIWWTQTWLLPWVQMF